MWQNVRQSLRQTVHCIEKHVAKCAAKSAADCALRKKHVAKCAAKSAADSALYSKKMGKCVWQSARQSVQPAGLPQSQPEYPPQGLPPLVCCRGQTSSTGTAFVNIYVYHIYLLRGTCVRLN